MNFLKRSVSLSLTYMTYMFLIFNSSFYTEFHRAYFIKDYVERATQRRLTLINYLLAS